jgi:hypothetical protein
MSHGAKPRVSSPESDFSIGAKGGEHLYAVGACQNANQVEHLDTLL